MKDGYGRTIEYMRISITDRCNLRCKYCMPHGIETVPMKDILTYEEILQITKIAAGLGIKYIKITGGEPLVRKGCADLIHQIKNIKGIEKVTITTNGVLLKHYMKDLIDAGIDGINISIDTLNPQLYEQMTGFATLDKVLESVKALSFSNVPIKINAVSLDLKSFGEQYGIHVKDEDYLDLIELARDYQIDVRFIEMMPIGYGKQFQTINHQEFLEKLQKHYPTLTLDHKQHGYGPAVYYHIDGFKGSVGLISAIHGKFCESCNRIRLTSQGYLKTCLCYNKGQDLRHILRYSKRVDEELKEVMIESLLHKPKAHCFENLEEITEDHDMVSIGG